MESPDDIGCRYHTMTCNCEDTIDAMHFAAEGIADHRVRELFFVFIDRMRRIIRGQDFASCSFDNFCKQRYEEDK